MNARTGVEAKKPLSNSLVKQKLSITLDEEVVEKLDEERGSFTRSAYINEILRKNL